VVLNVDMIHTFIRRVWVELSTLNGKILLIGNHYFPPDGLPTTTVILLF
jgi:hypothetical protein